MTGIPDQGFEIPAESGGYLRPNSAFAHQLQRQKHIYYSFFSFFFSLFNHFLA